MVLVRLIICNVLVVARMSRAKTDLPNPGDGSIKQMDNCIAQEITQSTHTQHLTIKHTKSHTHTPIPHTNTNTQKSKHTQNHSEIYNAIKYTQILHASICETSASKGAYNWNVPSFIMIYDRQPNWPTDRRTEGVIGNFHLQKLTEECP